MWLIKNNFQFGRYTISFNTNKTFHFNDKYYTIGTYILYFNIYLLIFLFCVHYKYVLNVSETPSLVNRTLPQGVKS